MQKELLDNLNHNNTLDEIQEYIKCVIDIRGLGNQHIAEYLLLLVEEVGELAKSIRKEKMNMFIDKSKINNYDTVEHEVADIFIALTSICNHLGINMFDALKNKEEINIKRKWDNVNKD